MSSFSKKDSIKCTLIMNLLSFTIGTFIIIIGGLFWILIAGDILGINRDFHITNWIFTFVFALIIYTSIELTIIYFIFKKKFKQKLITYIGLTNLSIIFLSHVNLFLHGHLYI